MKKYAKYFLLTLIIIVLDHALKLWVHFNMMQGDEIEIFSWFKLHFVLNPGIAYGIQMDFPFGKLVLSLVRMVAVIGLGWFLVRAVNLKYHKGLLWTLALIMGGAAGNMIDSVFYGVFLDNNMIFSAFTPWFHGQVIDMLYFPFLNGSFPEWFPLWSGQNFTFFSYIFNIADSAVFCGFFVLLLWQKKFFHTDEAAPADKEAISSESAPSLPEKNPEKPGTAS